MCSNFIAMESAKGIANTVIVGRNAIQYVQSYEKITIDNE